MYFLMSGVVCNTFHQENVIIQHTDFLLFLKENLLFIALKAVTEQAFVNILLSDSVIFPLLIHSFLESDLQ